jgi:hypothetical protein
MSVVFLCETSFPVTLSEGTINKKKKRGKGLIHPALLRLDIPYTLSVFSGYWRLENYCLLFAWS